MTAKGKPKIEAVAYLRTSSATNASIGNDKDSDKRQRAAIASFANSAGYVVVEEFYDVVSGADPVTERPGFQAMLERIAGNGVRVILVESPDRFARDLAVQLAGHDYLKRLGAISEFEKASLVAKLKGARERKRMLTGQKVGGRKSHAEQRPEVVALVRDLRRKRRKGGQRSLREISVELARQGFLNEGGLPFSAASISSMLRRA